MSATRRFAISLDTALQLAADRSAIAQGTTLVAPSLLRSDMLSRLYGSVRRGEMDRKEASRRLDHLRSLRLRLLGDRVVQAVAWRIAAELDWADTHTAEYIAVAQLQADAFVTLNPELGAAASRFVRVATPGELFL